MPRLVIIFLFLFGTPAWAGEVDGNSFFCESISFKGRFMSIEFSNGSVTTDNSLDDAKWWQYSATAKFVSWWERFDDLRLLYKLNRKTLILSLDLNAFGEKYYRCQFMEINAARKKVVEEENYYDKKAREGNKF